MPNAMQVINAGLYADRVVECVLKFQAKDADKQENRHDCRRALKADGFEVLGAGYYGFVVAGPADSGFVVKVCIDGNDGYPMYAKWAKANPQPGVVPVWLAERITDTCFVAVLPQLLSVDDSCNVRENVAQKAISAARYNEGHILPQFEYLRQTVTNVIEALGDFANEDMHYGNWMQCPETNMIYLTDPFAGLYVDREKAESTAARGVYVPPLKDQFDLFEPTYVQLRAIEDAKTAGAVAAGPNPFSTDFAACGLKSVKKSFPMPKPWEQLDRPCLARGGAGDGCNCAACRPKREDVKVVNAHLGGNLNFRVPPDLKPGVHNVQIQGMMANIMAMDDQIARDMGAFQQIARDNAAFFRQPVGHIQGLMRDNLRQQWFLEGVQCDEVQFRAWEVAKPLLRKKQKPDAELLRILGEAAERFGLRDLFPNLPVREVRYFPSRHVPVMRMNTEQLAQPVMIKQRLELDFNELERRVVAHAGRHQPNGRFDVRNIAGWGPPDIR